MTGFRSLTLKYWMPLTRAMPSAEEISEWTHNPANCPEWKNPHGGRLPITKADIMAALGFNVEYIASVLEEDAICDAEERAWERVFGDK